MPIELVKESDGTKAIPTGWLEVDPRWLASLWALTATGEVTVVLGKIHVGIAHPSLTRGQIVVGNMAAAFVPMNFSPKVP